MQLLYFEDTKLLGPLLWRFGSSFWNINPSEILRTTPVS